MGTQALSFRAARPSVRVNSAQVEAFSDRLAVDFYLLLILKTAVYP